jgi:hypothetical protein
LIVERNRTVQGDRDHDTIVSYLDTSKQAKNFGLLLLRKEFLG